MWVTRSDFEFLRQVAIRHAAGTRNIPEYRDGELDQLRVAIRKKDPELADALEHFLVAYDAWVTYHEDIERTESQGRLSRGQSERLTRLSGEKDAARERFLKVLRR